MISRVVAISIVVSLGIGSGLAVVGYHEEDEYRHWVLSTEVAGNSKWIMIQEYRRLSLAKRQRRLTLDEWLLWCEAGVVLEIFKVCPSR